MRLSFLVAGLAILLSSGALATACGGNTDTNIPGAESGPDGIGNGDGGKMGHDATTDGPGRRDTSPVDTGPNETSLFEGGFEGGFETGVGCTSPADCPIDEACDTATGVCTLSCAPGQACNGGCCNAGSCSSGMSPMACGAKGGLCHSCSGSSAGSACLSDGTCGCESATDCPSDEACDTTTHACTTACTSGQPCNGGCCDPSSRMCAPGTSKKSCGTTGAACVSCVGGAKGSSCLATGVCGCAATTDCPADEACDLLTGACTSACSSTQACNGGCCSAASGGTCVPGTADTACGTSGVCENCTTGCPSGVSCTCNFASTCFDSETFTYTGSLQTFVVPSGVTQIDVEAYGGSEGACGAVTSGNGGQLAATIPVVPGETLNIFVGGAGSCAGVGGFNGGGAGGMGATTFGGGGGGATDIREGGLALANRVIVAAGGGGASHLGELGGAGGTLTGGTGLSDLIGGGGAGGSQVAGGAGGTVATMNPGVAGSLAVGGAGGPGLVANAGGGGGGGYYGGGGGYGGSGATNSGGGGGGGSSYAEATATGVAMVAGGHAGNGRVVLSW